MLNNNVLFEINIWLFSFESMRQKILLVFFWILFCFCLHYCLIFFEEILRNFFAPCSSADNIKVKMPFWVFQKFFALSLIVPRHQPVSLVPGKDGWYVFRNTVIFSH